LLAGTRPDIFPRRRKAYAGTLSKVNLAKSSFE